MEKIILESLLISDEYLRKVLPHLDRSYFGDEEAVIFALVKKYTNKYGKAPTPKTLLIDLEEKKINPTALGNCKSLIKTFSNKLENDVDWLVDKTEEFCKEKSLYNAIMKSINIIHGDEKNVEKGIIPEILSDALSVSFDTSIGHDFLEDAEERFAYYHNDEERIPCDLTMVNKITKGGFPRKTLNIVLAGTGVGKSFFLCHMAAAYMAEGKNVLYITLEMDEKRIAQRIDANCMGVNMDSFKEMELEEYMKKVSKVRRKYLGRLKIKEYPSSSVHTGHFRNLVHELKMKQSFVPDIIIVDYINLCNSSRVRRSNNVNSYTLVQSIAQELLGFASEQNVAILTATQTVRAANAPGVDLEVTDVSESHGLSATADFILGLIKSEEMEAQGQILCKQIKNRYGDENKNRRFLLGLDRDRGRFFDIEASAQNAVTRIENKFEKKMKQKNDFSALNY